jgi:hypothetical protein
MKTVNTILWNVGVALALLLGAGAAHAQTPDVILDGNGFVVEIRDLTVIHQDETTHLYDVTFEAGSAFDVYGNEPVFDFGVEEENAALAIIASFKAINDEAPVPMRAGADGADQFFAGTLLNEGIVETFGAEYFLFPPGNNPVPNTWDECDRDEQELGQKECIQGVLAIPPNDVVTWALFTPVGTADEPEISLTPTSLAPATLLGEDAGDQQFTVTNSGSGTLEYTVADDQTWLSVSPPGGTSDGEMNTITVSYTTAGLDGGVHTATITVRDPNALNDPQTVDVTLFVTEEPAIGLSPTVLMPEAALGNDALSDTFTVQNAGGFFLFYDVTVDAAWLSVDPEGGVSLVAPDTITVSYATSGLGEGVHQGTITVSDPGAVNNPQAIAVVLTVTSAGSLGTTEVRQTKKVNTIPGLDSALSGTYDKPGFPLLLPQSGITGSTLFHDGGSFSFSSTQTMTAYTYGDWAFEIRSTCAANGDACLVQTDNGTPWALRDVDVTAGTARMVFTDEGRDAFNDLAGAPSTVQVFVTSQSFTGDLRGSAGELTGLDGADNLCTQAAIDAGLEGAWTAWVSQDSVDVVDRMFDAEFQLLDGTVVANNLADLTDGTLDAAIDLDEKFDTVSAASVWTATETDGRYGGSGTCDSWTSSDVGNSGLVGKPSAVDADWTDVGGGNSCEKANRLYCFSASKFLTEETFGDATFIPEPSAAALGAAALTTLGLIRVRRRRR